MIVNALTVAIFFAAGSMAAQVPEVDTQALAENDVLEYYDSCVVGSYDEICPIPSGCNKNGDNQNRCTLYCYGEDDCDQYEMNFGPLECAANHGFGR